MELCITLALLKWNTTVYIFANCTCLVDGFNALVSAGGLNLPDKQADPDCWLRSGFKSPRRQYDFKPLSGSYQPWTLHCRATLICASFGGGLMIYYHYHYRLCNLEITYNTFICLYACNLIYLKDDIAQRFVFRYCTHFIRLQTCDY